MRIINRLLCMLWIAGCMAFAVVVSGSAASGCAASSQHMKTELPFRPVAHAAETPATQPAAGLDIASVFAQQAGAVNAIATATAKLAATVDTKVNASATGVGGDVAGYRSEFGVGAVVAVCVAMMAALGLVWIVLRNSHLRELKRIDLRKS